MALNISTRYTFRVRADLIRLVEAIHSASPEDETNWLEWKSGLDLFKPRDRFNLAKAIIGMANRMPEVAEQHCEGFGYVVVGVEPGNRTGVTRIDPAKIQDALQPYLGVNGPRWQHDYVEHEGSYILVISVDSPRLGDPMHYPRKAFNGGRAGTPFVRRAGKTEPANAQDMDNLQERLSGSRLDVRLEVPDNLPISWFDGLELNALLDRIVEEEQDRLLRPIVADHVLRSLGTSQQGLFRIVENRSIPEYREQIDKWSTNWRSTSEDAWIVWHVDNYASVRRLRVTNLTQRNYRGLQVRIEIPSATIGAYEDLEAREPPSPPATFGTGGLSTLLSPLPIGPLHVLPLDYCPPDIWIENSDHGQQLVWDVGDVRLLEIRESDEYYVLFDSEVPPEPIDTKWHATATNIDGINRGVLILPVSEDPIDLEAFAKYLKHQLIERRQIR